MLDRKLYDKAHAAVTEWLDESESYSLRYERLLEDLEGRPVTVNSWLIAAWLLGYQQAMKEQGEAEG